MLYLLFVKILLQQTTKQLGGLTIWQQLYDIWKTFCSYASIATLFARDIYSGCINAYAKTKLDYLCNVKMRNLNPASEIRFRCETPSRMEGNTSNQISARDYFCDKDGKLT